MKKLLILLSLLYVCNISAQQKIVKYWFINDTIAFKSVQIGDTIKNYKGDAILTNIIIENDSIREVYIAKDDSLKLFYKCITKIEVALIHDNRCNGITLKGVRCARTADNSRGNFYCWQHKK